jgi:DNA repair exonuclease SbcCD nuclease subunit
MKFLHIADVHLGCRRYNVEERTKDFARAWSDVITRHAIGNAVDFVVIVGDFFDRRHVEPQAMNHAMIGLRALKEAGIPVVAIEGNHDMRDAGAEHSWLRSLAYWGYLKLLEPLYDDAGNISLQAWDEEEFRGSYIDLAGARIFGSNWYGASAQHAIPALADALRDARDANLFNILLLHTDVEGQLNRPVITAIPVAKLKELQQTVDYLALGHTHKRFELDNWAFNPGSLEACSIDEYREERGAFLVEVDENKQIKAMLCRDYRQRHFDRLSFDVSGKVDADAVYEGVMATVESEFQPQGGEQPPIVEMTLRGHLGFKNSLLPLKKMREDIRERTGALHVHLRNQSIPIEYAVSAGLDEQAPRHQRERHILEGLVMQDNRFKNRAADMAELIIEVKKMSLAHEDKSENRARADKIYELIEQKLAVVHHDAAPETPAQLALKRNAIV